MRFSGIVFVVILMSLLSVSPAYAYVGPGLGAGTLAVVLGLIASLFLAIFAVVWYPLKRLFGKNTRQKSAVQDFGKKETD
ncbi:MAG: hypothetical protein R6U22_11970 [Desulfohalobiaceae bacterium]